MAPEQRLGEADNRTDIYAMGGILFHILTGSPPHASGYEEAHQIPLPRTIPLDLQAIVKKAMARVPRDRYQTADSFASDLRRFTLNQQVIARQYTISERALRFLNRNRAVTISVITGLSLAVTILAISLVRIQSANTSLIATQGALILENAESLLHRDPSSAHAALAGYNGSDIDRVERLEAEAHGRGISLRQMDTHSDGVQAIQVLKGHRILTLGEDQKLAITDVSSARGEERVVSNEATFPIAANDDVSYFAFQSGERSIVVLNTTSLAKEYIFASGRSSALAISPDGETIAVGFDKVVTIRKKAEGWSAGRVIAAPKLAALYFTRSNQLAIFEWDRVRLILGDGREQETPVQVASRTQAGDHFAIGTVDGRALVISTEALAKLSELKVCPALVNSVALVPKRNLIAYVCADGHVGIRDLATGAVVDELTNNPPARTLATSLDGHFLVSLTDGKTALVYSIDAQLSLRLEGHSSRVTAIAGPSPNSAYFFTGDINGHIRQWELPNTDQWLLARVRSGIYSIALSSDGREAAVDGDEGAVNLVDLSSRKAVELDGRFSAEAYGVRFSSSGKRLLSAGFDGELRVWSIPDGRLLRRFVGHGASSADALFLDEDTVVSAGEDGHVYRWSVTGNDAANIFSVNAPLHWIRKLEQTGELVVVDGRSRIWLTGRNGDRLVYEHPNQIVAFTMSKLQDVAVLGDEVGNVIVITIPDWKVLKKRGMGGAIRALVINPCKRQVAISSKNGKVAIWDLDQISGSELPDMSIGARNIAFSPDGRHAAFVTQADGVWLYSDVSPHWKFWQTQAVENRTGTFTADGRLLIVVDSTGRLVAHTVPATHE